MRKPGTNEDDVRMSDVLCDFCTREWTDTRHMVEGHQGSCICSECLTAAYRMLVLQGAGAAPEGFKCTLCLENRPGGGWAGARGVFACERCVKQSAGVLTKDKDYGWSKPTE